MALAWCLWHSAMLDRHNVIQRTHSLHDLWAAIVALVCCFEAGVSAAKSGVAPERLQCLQTCG